MRLKKAVLAPALLGAGALILILGAALLLMQLPGPLAAIAVGAGAMGIVAGVVLQLAE
jgi:small-conductance mechanosensitive channel